MDEKIENQELNLPEVTDNDLVKELKYEGSSEEISEAELAELAADFENQPLGEIKWRHPQQVLTNREAQILLTKKEEELTESEKYALKWLILRARNHGSSPKKVLTKTQNKRKRLKRKMAKQSRKANR